MQRKTDLRNIPPGNPSSLKTSHLIACELIEQQTSHFCYAFFTGLQYRGGPRSGPPGSQGLLTFRALQCSSAVTTWPRKDPHLGVPPKKQALLLRLLQRRPQSGPQRALKKRSLVLSIYFSRLILGWGSLCGCVNAYAWCLKVMWPTLNAILMQASHSYIQTVVENDNLTGLWDDKITWCCWIKLEIHCGTVLTSSDQVLVLCSEKRPHHTSSTNIQPRLQLYPLWPAHPHLSPRRGKKITTKSENHKSQTGYGSATPIPTSIHVQAHVHIHTSQTELSGLCSHQCVELHRKIKTREIVEGSEAIQLSNY